MEGRVQPPFGLRLKLLIVCFSQQLAVITQGTLNRRRGFDVGKKASFLRDIYLYFAHEPLPFYVPTVCPLIHAARSRDR